MSNPPLLTLILFGMPHLERDSQSIKIDTWKALALLAYLALHDQPQHRAALATLFWPDEGEAQARASLRRALWTLRQALPRDAIEGDKHLVRLRPPLGWLVDVQQFQTLVAAVNATSDRPTGEQLAKLGAAVALYRADFLAGFTLPDCPVFSEWQFFTADHLRRSLAIILQRLIDSDTAQQNYPAAIENARRWLALDPLHEPAHRRLMQLYAWNGQQVAALRQYEECRRLLKQESGVLPEETTSQLYTAIRNNRLASPTDTAPLTPVRPPAPTASASALHTLPALLTPLLGRTLELAELDMLMFDRGERLITITGPGGIGKTRLALAVAEHHLRAHRFRDGVYFVSLAGIDNPQNIASLLINLFELSFEDFQTPADSYKRQLLTFLADKQLLLVFDNFEQVLEGRTLLLEIVNAAPAVHLVVTARERLHLQVEQVYSISGLECPTTSDDLEAPALLLFLRTARHLQPHFQPNQADLVELGRICHLVAGMPLALELAAGWVHMMPLTAIVESLQVNLDLLETATYGVPLRHRSMRATFDVTWQLLTDDERRIYAQLGVFRGGFQMEAAEQVSGATRKHLSAFADKSLIVYQYPRERYVLHELLRHYATEKRLEIDKRDDTLYRHLGYFLKAAKDEIPKPPISRDSFSESLIAEYDNFCAALTYGLSTPHVEHFAQHQGPHNLHETPWFLAANLVLALEALWFYHQQWTEGLAWVKKALDVLKSRQEAAEIEVITLRSKLLISAGIFTFALSDYRQTVVFMQEGLATYRASEDTPNIVRSLQELGGALTEQGNFAQALPVLEESLTLAYHLQDNRLIGLSLVKLGFLEFSRGNYPRAIEFTAESLSLFRRDNHLGCMISALNILGQIATAQGELMRATDFFEQALAINRLQNPESQGGPWTLGNLALVIYLQSDYPRAAMYYRKSLLLRYEQRHLAGMAWCIEGLAHIAMATSNPLRAARFWGMAEALRTASGVVLSVSDQARHDGSLVIAQSLLDSQTLSSEWAHGQVISLGLIISETMEQ